MENWSASRFAIVGFIAGFVLNTIIFMLNIFGPSPHVSLIEGFIMPGFLAGIVGLLIAILVHRLFAHNRRSVAFGILLGIAFYFGWTVIFRFLIVY